MSARVTAADLEAAHALLTSDYATDGPTTDEDGDAYARVADWLHAEIQRRRRRTRTRPAAVRSARERVVCPSCHREVAASIPQNGDGSGLRLAPHGPRNARCAHSGSVVAR